MAQHISSDEIELFTLRRVPVNKRRRIIEHLKSCAVCRANVRRERSLRNTLVEAFRYLPDADEPRVAARPQSAGWQISRRVKQASSECRIFTQLSDDVAGKPYTVSATVCDNAATGFAGSPVAINARTLLSHPELRRFGLSVTMRTEASNFVTIGR